MKTLMMAYLDDELSEKERARFEAHLAQCGECSRELSKFSELKEELAMVKFKEPTDVELERYCRGVYNRIERGLGWVLFSVGAIVLLCYGAFKLIEEMVHDPSVSVVLKVGVIALVFGAVVLFVSLLRERLAVRKADRYSRKVER